MNVNQTWQQNRPKKIPVNIPVEQVEGIMRVTRNNAYDYAMQLCTEMSMLALSEEFGFGEERITRYLIRMTQELNRFSENVEWEFDSETIRMNFKEREAARPDLAFTLEELDQRLKKLIPAERWKPYQERYGSFGGRGSWCK